MEVDRVRREEEDRLWREETERREERSRERQRKLLAGLPLTLDEVDEEISELKEDLDCEDDRDAKRDLREQIAYWKEVRAGI